MRKLLIEVLAIVLMISGAAPEARGRGSDPLEFDKETALIIVDVQYDFLEGGALAVPGSKRIITPLISYAKEVARGGGVIVTTQDWHPKNHCSFQTTPYKCSNHNDKWPEHAVQGTKGAAIETSLMSALKGMEAMFQASFLNLHKGFQVNEDSYSGFGGKVVQGGSGGLAEALRAKKIKKLFVAGLATEYCVKNTAADGSGKGFSVTLLNDASAGINEKNIKDAQQFLNSIHRPRPTRIWQP